MQLESQPRYTILALCDVQCSYWDQHEHRQFVRAQRWHVMGLHLVELQRAAVSDFVSAPHGGICWSTLIQALYEGPHQERGALLQACANRHHLVAFNCASTATLFRLTFDCEVL